MNPVVVPHTALSSGALIALVEEFVTRDGTDYGDQECDLETKKAGVMRQLEAGDIVVVFDPESETATIVLARDLTQL